MLDKNDLLFAAVLGVGSGKHVVTDHPDVGQAGTGAGETLDSNYLITDGQPFFRTGSKWVQDHITP